MAGSLLLRTFLGVLLVHGRSEALYRRRWLSAERVTVAQVGLSSAVSKRADNSLFNPDTGKPSEQDVIDCELFKYYLSRGALFDLHEDAISQSRRVGISSVVRSVDKPLT